MPRSYVLMLAFVCAFTASFQSIQAASAGLRVVVTIKPVQSLVAGVMDGIGNPRLVWDSAVTPHGASLKPSQIRMLEDADVIFYIGKQFEVSLSGELERARQAGVRVAELLLIPHLVTYTLREGGIWEGHGHEEGSHVIDPHIWLDPQNAKAITEYAAEILAEADPGNAGNYRANAAGMIKELDALDREIAGELKPLARLPYVVFHDAYQYFERRYATNGVGAITIDPHRTPGARRLSEIRNEISRRGAVCVFAEPQFEVGYVRTVIEGSDAKSAVIDPLGVGIEPGKDAYASLLRSITRAMTDCLGPSRAD